MAPPIENSGLFLDNLRGYKSESDSDYEPSETGDSGVSDVNSDKTSTSDHTSTVSNDGYQDMKEDAGEDFGADHGERSAFTKALTSIKEFFTTTKEVETQTDPVMIKPVISTTRLFTVLTITAIVMGAVLYLASGTSPVEECAAKVANMTKQFNTTLTEAVSNATAKATEVAMQTIEAATNTSFITGLKEGGRIEYNNCLSLVTGIDKHVNCTVKGSNATLSLVDSLFKLYQDKLCPAARTVLECNNI